MNHKDLGVGRVSQAEGTDDSVPGWCDAGSSWLFLQPVSGEGGAWGRQSREVGRPIVQGFLAAEGFWL